VRRAWWWLGGLVGGLAAACSGLNVGSEDGCAAACDIAHQCGFLPSGLGYAEDEIAAVADCERRCGDTPRTDGVSRIQSCLDGSWEPEVAVASWCEAEDGALDSTLGTTCALASACFEREFKGSRLQGSVDLTVSLISFEDFTYHFGEGAIAALYAEEVDGALTSCERALCGKLDCADDREVEVSCDTTMCGKGMLHAGQICEELAARSVEVGAASRGMLVSQVLLDETDASGCDDSSREFTGTEYKLSPGPIHAFARISGRLPAAVLAELDIEAVDQHEEGADFCLEFRGMNVTLRAGQNAVLVPVASIEDIVAAGVRPSPCER
jgi:hypothetical protein